MSRRTAAAAVAASLLVVLLAWALAGCRKRGAEGGEPGVAAPVEPVAAAEITLSLYFPAGSRLHLEERLVANPGGRAETVRAILEELLAGPAEPGRYAPFTSAVEVAGVFVSPNKIAYVDLVSQDGSPPPASGSLTELLSVYSVVNSVLATSPDLRGVVLLWNGLQRPSFAGHLDTSRPLRVKKDLIARGR